MDNTTAQKIKEATAPSWKKVLIWMVAILAVIIGVVVLLIMLFRKKGPVGATIDVIDYARQQIQKAEVDAAITIAKAEAVEDEVVRQLEEIRNIPDEVERAKRLAALF